MKKLKVLVGNNTKILMDYCLEEVKKVFFDINQENIIIVPDRLSLITENEIFDKLNVDVYFNLSVMGITKFVKMIIDDLGLNTVQCSLLSSKLLTLKAIQNTSQNFKCFSKNYTLGFIDEIYAKIEQIKSSDINIDSLQDPNASRATLLKFEDLKLIYNEYEKLRDYKYDGSALLNLFNQMSNTSDLLKKCNVFFVGFNAMTKQGINLVKTVTKNAHSCTVSVVEPNGQDNERIYDRTFYKSIQSLEEDSEIQCEYKWFNTPLKNNFADIALNNLFSHNKSFDGNNYFQINKATTIADEIDNCAKSINFMLRTKKYNFCDIGVCAPQDYHRLLESKLDELGIDVYCDEKVPLIYFEPIKMIVSYLKYCLSNMPDDYLQFISNDFYEVDLNVKQNIINLIYQYASINTILKYEKNLDKETKNILEKNIFIKTDKQSNETKKYIEIVNNFIKNTNLYEKIGIFCEKLKNEGNIKLEKQYRQIATKLDLILKEVQETLNETKLTFEQFVEIFSKALCECEISAIPGGVNQVMIADYKSFFGDIKCMYVLGLNENVCPEILSDNGLITDKEILSETIKAKIEPTTKIINIRNKFKLLEVITNASEKCYLFYHSVGQDGKTTLCNDFISEIKFLFNIDEIPTKLLNTYSQNNTLSLMYNLQNIYNANIDINENNNDINNEYIKQVLLNNNSLFTYKKPDFKFNDYNKLFFENNKANISLVESYNKCPKLAFLDKGIKLVKQKRSKIESNIYGIFIHKIGEMFVKDNKKLGSLNETEIKEKVYELINELKGDERFYALVLDENKFLFNLLKNECERFCTFLNYEQSKSEFKPKYEELYFGSSLIKPLEIKVNGETYKVTGIVDRVDFCGEDFRIIDYKTGSTDNTNKEGKEQLFYGKKIQLFVYAKAVKENTNKNLFGAFYLPISNAFAGKNKPSYYLSGFMNNDVKTMLRCDCDFLQNRKSNIIKVELKKSENGGEEETKKKEYILSQDELNSYLEYAVKIMEVAIKNMASGVISPSPFGDHCRLCSFADICEKCEDEEIQRKKEYDIKNTSILEIVNADKTKQ